MIRKFVDRKQELDFLKQSFEENKKQCIVIYGRRRVGKTELINHFLKDKPHIYFLANERGTRPNAKRLAKKASDYFDDVTPDVRNFDEVFTYIVKRTTSPLIVAIDEFSYLVKSDESIPSVFQGIWDEILDKNISLILLGSSISMMMEGVLSYKSPLYGRRTGQWDLSPLDFKNAIKFFPDYSFTDKIRAYSILGGIPAYLKKFDPKKSVFGNIGNKIVRKGRFLYEEPEFLLREELRKPARYMSILKSIASGATRVTDIANKSQMKARDTPKYLNKLERMRLIKKVMPVTFKGKKGIYKIKDNFIRFWFRFIYPNLDNIEGGARKGVLNHIKSTLNEYVSKIFEDVCKQSVRIKQFPHIGKWWYKDNEIDIVGLNKHKNEILLGECKWTKKKTRKKAMTHLEETSKKVKWHNKQRKEHYALFSKAGFTKGLKKAAKDRKDVKLYDLKRIEKGLEK